MRVIAFTAALAVLSSAFAGPLAAQTPYAAATAAPSAEAAGLRLLTWPGKTPAPERSRRAPAHVQARAAVAPPAAAPAALPTSPRAPAPAAAPLPRAAIAPTPPAPAPPTQGPSAPPAKAQAQTAASGYPTPRFYSLHRAYGQAPDPIPLSPQFFATPTQDLAEPPPPAPRTVVTANGQVVRTMNADTGVN